MPEMSRNNSLVGNSQNIQSPWTSEIQGYHFTKTCSCYCNFEYKLIQRRAKPTNLHPPLLSSRLDRNAHKPPLYSHQAFMPQLPAISGGGTCCHCSWGSTAIDTVVRKHQVLHRRHVAANIEMCGFLIVSISTTGLQTKDTVLVQENALEKHNFESLTQIQTTCRVEKVTVYLS